MMIYIPDALRQSLPTLMNKENPMVYAKLTTDLGWEYYILSYSKGGKAFRAYALPDEEFATVTHDDLLKLQLQYDAEIDWDYDFQPQPLKEVLNEQHDANDTNRR